MGCPLCRCVSNCQEVVDALPNRKHSVGCAWVRLVWRDKGTTSVQERWGSGAPEPPDILPTLIHLYNLCSICWFISHHASYQYEQLVHVQNVATNDGQLWIKNASFQFWSLELVCLGLEGPNKDFNVTLKGLWPEAKWKCTTPFQCPFGGKCAKNLGIYISVVWK